MSVLDLFSLDGEVAVVTGGGSGLGRDMALALAEAGASLVLAEANPASAESTAAEIRALGREAMALVLDVADRAAVERGFATVLDRYGRIDVLVNNAGIGRLGATLDATPEDWRQVFAVNVDAVFFCCKQAGQAMVEQRHGKIINIASVYALVGIDERLYVSDDVLRHRGLSYSASKGAVVALTRELAVEWAPDGVNVNAIAPGMMRTQRLGSKLSDRTWENLRQRTPQSRWGTGEDLKGAVVYLASRASDFVTGHVLVVDGGWTAW